MAWFDAEALSSYGPRTTGKSYGTR